MSIDNLLDIFQKKSKYGIIHVPIGNMQNLVKNNNYIFDYGQDNIFETKMKSLNCDLTLIHYYDTCKYEPSNVTYVIHCPQCSKYGNDSVTSTYLQTTYSKLRFYLTHSVYDCPVIRTKKCKLISNLLCDQCYEPL